MLAITNAREHCDMLAFSAKNTISAVLSFYI